MVMIIPILLEWLVYLLPPFWKVRRAAILLPMALTVYGTVLFYIEEKNVWCVFVAVVSLFRVINHLRIVKNRMHEAYLRRTAMRTGFVLGAAQITLAVAAVNFAPSFSDSLRVLVAAQIVIAAVLLLVAVSNIRKTKHRPALENYADKELPTVTIAIPARNETRDLEDCLRSIIANNYPKFEVLVLDDCSHDRTPEIIKQFAQDGVRFIQGDEPKEHWLAKNQAYDKLAEEATGEILVFCGVDVRFGPETIRSLITTLLAKKKDMLSVLPRRMSSDVLAAFIQPLRYWWELAIPRKLLNRPSVLSTCWVIRRKTLEKLGGFDAVQHTILPEGYFAREVVKSNGYSFIRADDVLDVQTRKGLPEQRDTAVRMRYPQLRRRLEWVTLLVTGELLFFAGPFAVAASALWAGFGTVQLAALTASVLLVVTHVSIVQVSNPANVLVAAVNLPIVIATELFLGLSSMFKYEFSTVDWKGRNVCEPVMHVIPRLPSLDENNPKA